MIMMIVQLAVVDLDLKDQEARKIEQSLHQMVLQQ